MDWKKTAFDWNRARAFLATAQAGSFSAAARELGVAQPTLGRQVAALEEELGVTLFERVGKSLQLTATGLDLVEQVRSMNEAATRMSLIAAGKTQLIEGVVRIAASEVLAAFFLPPIVRELGQRHAGLEIEIVVSNQTSDLARREADIAVRHFRPTGDELFGKLIKEQSAAHLYATPSYLEDLGNPQTPEALAIKGRVFAYDHNDLLQKGLAARGLPFTAHTYAVRTDNHLVQWQLAKQGAGMCIMMQEVGDRDPALCRLRAIPSRTVPVFAGRN